MDKDQKTYGEVMEHISEVNEKLKRRDILTDKECADLLQELMELPNEETLHPIVEKVIFSLDIDELRDEYLKCAEEAKRIIKTLLAVIESGRVPDHISQNEFENAIVNLNSKYDLIKECARLELSEEELPEDNSSVSVYFEAIRNCKSALLRKQLREIGDILNAFISVHSPVAKYSTALEPYQHEAQRLLESIELGKEYNVEEVIERSSGPRLFMRTLEWPDLNADEGQELLDLLETNYHFPSYVTRGLLSKSYYISEDRNQNSDKEETDLCNSDYRNALIKKKVVLSENQLGMLSSEINEAESKKITASIFISDLKKGFFPMIKNVVQMIAEFPLISPELISVRCRVQVDTGKAICDYLQKRGYLRKYRVVPGGEFYCPSPRLIKALSFKEAARFVGARQSSEVSEQQIVEDRAENALTRLALLKLYINSMAHFKTLGAKNSKSRSIISTTSFLQSNGVEDNLDQVELLLGVFWVNYDEVDEYISQCRKIIVDSKCICRVVFAAQTKEIAEAVLEVIFHSASEKISKESVYIYLPSENRFISYASKEEIDEADIW